MTKNYTINARDLAFALLKTFAVVLCGHLIVVLSHFVIGWKASGLTVLLDMDLETNLPVFFNCMLFFLLAVICWFAGSTEQQGRHGWYLLALVLLFLGVDEGSQIHERFMLWTLRLINDGDHSTDMGFLHYAWVLPYLVAGIALLVVLSRFLFRLPAATRNGLLVSGAIYVAGAAFVEMLSGKIAKPLEGESSTEALACLPCQAYPVGECNLYLSPGYVFTYTVEESLEMLGLIACCYVVIRHLQREGMELMLRTPRS